MHDAVGMRVIHPNEDVEIVLVVRGLELGLEGRVDVDARRELAECRGLGGGSPDAVIVASVDQWSLTSVYGDRVHRGGRRAIGGGPWHLGSRRESGAEGEEMERHWRFQA